jgi:fumarate reductase subunit D
MSKHWEPCPRCGSNKVKLVGKAQGLMSMFAAGGCLGIIFFPIWLILLPLMLILSLTPKSNHCEDCKHVWKVNKKKKEVSV